LGSFVLIRVVDRLPPHYLILLLTRRALALHAGPVCRIDGRTGFGSAAGSAHPQHRLRHAVGFLFEAVICGADLQFRLDSRPAEQFQSGLVAEGLLQLHHSGDSVPVQARGRVGFRRAGG
jgi:hypothetical protein